MQHPQCSNAYGPARGLLNALEVTGMTLNVHQGAVLVEDGFGAKIPLDTMNNSELALAIRKSIRMTIAKQLRTRANSINKATGKVTRKDITEFPDYVDHGITNKLLKAKECSEDKGVGYVSTHKKRG